MDFVSWLANIENVDIRPILGYHQKGTLKVDRVVTETENYQLFHWGAERQPFNYVDALWLVVSDLKIETLA